MRALADASSRGSGRFHQDTRHLRPANSSPLYNGSLTIMSAVVPPVRSRDSRDPRAANEDRSRIRCWIRIRHRKRRIPSASPLVGCRCLAKRVIARASTSRETSLWTRARLTRCDAYASANLRKIQTPFWRADADFDLDTEADGRSRSSSSSSDLLVDLIKEPD